MVAIFLTCQALRKNKNKNKFNVNPRNKSTELEVISDDESGDENDEISYTTINFEDDDEENGKPNPNERQKLLWTSKPLACAFGGHNHEAKFNVVSICGQI